MYIYIYILDGAGAVRPCQWANGFLKKSNERKHR